MQLATVTANDGGKIEEIKKIIKMKRGVALVILRLLVEFARGKSEVELGLLKGPALKLGYL